MSEAHRFAKSFAEKTKTKSQLESFLDNIKGIGKKRKEILLQNFKSLEEIANASLEKLASLPGFNLKVARTLKTYLQNKI